MPKIVDRKDMQDKILNAAQICLAEQGYHGCKMGDLALAAGIAKGTLYLYFDTKEALVIALITRQFAQFEAQFPDKPCQNLPAFEQRLQGMLDLTEAQLGGVRLFFDLLGPGFANDAIRQVISAFFDALGRSFARDLRALQKAGEIPQTAEPEVLGRALAAMLDGMVIHRALFTSDPAHHLRQVHALCDVLLEGLRPRR